MSRRKSARFATTSRSVTVTSSSSMGVIGLNALDHVSRLFQPSLDFRQQATGKGQELAGHRGQLARSGKLLFQHHLETQIGDPSDQQILMNDQLASFPLEHFD